MTHLTEGLSLKKFRMSKFLTYRMLSFTESSGRLDILLKIYIYGFVGCMLTYLYLRRVFFIGIISREEQRHDFIGHFPIIRTSSGFRINECLHAYTDIRFLKVSITFRIPQPLKLAISRFILLHVGFLPGVNSWPPPPLFRLVEGIWRERTGKIEELVISECHVQGRSEGVWGEQVLDGVSQNPVAVKGYFDDLPLTSASSFASHSRFLDHHGPVIITDRPLPSPRLVGGLVSDSLEHPPSQGYKFLRMKILVSCSWFFISKRS